MAASRESGHDQCHIADTSAQPEDGAVDPTQLLAACGLVIGTVDYALMVRRRAATRKQWRAAVVSQASRTP
jgi:hypothetical protein